MKLDKLLTKVFPTIEHELTARDCMLYALGVGVGARPEDPADLQFCYEKDLAVFPSMVNVIAHPGLWVKDPVLELDWVKLLHAAQSFEIHRPLQPGRKYLGSYRIDDVVDRGQDRGALVYMTKELREPGDPTPVASVSSTYLLRGDGGCGGTLAQPRRPAEVPDREPDAVLDMPILPQAALIYRLSGDQNPIHVDPALAKRAGFERPILHGLCSLGVATHAVMQLCCDGAPARLQRLGARFTAPVYPGETLRVELWRNGTSAAFRARVVQRDVVALDNGEASFHPAQP